MSRSHWGDYGPGPPPVRIMLAWGEYFLGANVGVARNVQSLQLGRKTEVPDKDLWTNNIDGAHAEQSAAKHLRRYWDGALGDIDAPDVGPYQVKCNGSRYWDDLIVPPLSFRKPGSLDIPYISVLALKPREFLITGWKWGREIQKARWWWAGAPTPAYFFPRGLLYDIRTLPDLPDPPARSLKDGAPPLPKPNGAWLELEFGE